MPTFRLTTEAKSDLIGIRRYTLERWGGDQSNKYLADLRSTLKLLAENPFLGKNRPEVGEEVFSLPHGSHVIYYLVRKEIVIFGVLHKRMVPMKHLVKREIEKL